MEKDELYKMIDERDGYSSLAFPALMRKVYVWMAMALVITAVAAYAWPTLLPCCRLFTAAS